MSSRSASAVPRAGLAGVAFLRLGGWSAIGFAAIILLTNLLILAPAGIPTTGANAGEVSEFFASKTSSVGLASVCLPAAWVLATIFGASVVTAGRQLEAGRFEGWALVGFAGLLLQNATFAAVTGIRLGLAESTPQGDDSAGLWDLHEALFTLNGTFLALGLVGLTLSGVRTGLVPAGLLPLGLLAAALLFASASLTPLVMEHGGLLGLVGLAGWLLWVGWLVVYGICLVRRNGAYRP